MTVTKKEIKINHIPAVIWGSSSEKVWLYVHGQGGNKEEAQSIAQTLCRYGCQVLSLDLPEHGSRNSEPNSFVPWHVVPELAQVMRFLMEHWEHVSLFANSIGAWFSMLSFGGERLEQCLLVSPVLDMKQLQLKMMRWANVSEEQLRKERVIQTSFGQTLSWEYWEYVLANPITAWKPPTQILYGGRDHLIDRDTVERFACKFHCGLEIMEEGEHWFHTEEETAFMQRWIRQKLGDEKA